MPSSILSDNHKFNYTGLLDKHDPEESNHSDDFRSNCPSTILQTTTVSSTQASTSSSTTSNYNNQITQTTSSTIVSLASSGCHVSLSLSASPSSGVAPLTVAFNTQVTGATGPIQYDWWFGARVTRHRKSNDVLHLPECLDLQCIR